MLDRRPRQPVCMCVCARACLCERICPSVRLSVCLSMCLCVYVPLCLFLSMSPSLLRSLSPTRHTYPPARQVSLLHPVLCNCRSRRPTAAQQAATRQTSKRDQSRRGRVFGFASREGGARVWGWEMSHKNQAHRLCGCACSRVCACVRVRVFVCVRARACIHR